MRYMKSLNRACVIVCNRNQTIFVVTNQMLVFFFSSVEEFEFLHMTFDVELVPIIIFVTHAI